MTSSLRKLASSCSSPHSGLFSFVDLRCGASQGDLEPLSFLKSSTYHSLSIWIST